MSNVSFEQTLEKRRKEKEQERNYEDLLIDSEKYEPVGKGANNKPSSEMSEYEKVANEHGILSKEAIDAMASEYLLSGSEKYVGSTTSTGENESGGDGMEGFEGYLLRAMGWEDYVKKLKEEAERQKEIEEIYAYLVSDLAGEEQKHGKENDTNQISESGKILLSLRQKKEQSETENDTNQISGNESVSKEIIGEVKQTDYSDDIVISFSRWELMGFIIALIVGIIVSALIVVAVKNNKRDHNRTVKNAIACDRTPEAKDDGVVNGGAEVGVEPAAVIATEVGAEVAAEINVAVDAEADTECNDATVDEINKEESTEATVKTDEKSDTRCECSERGSALKNMMQSVAFRNVLGVVAGLVSFALAVFAVGLLLAWMVMLEVFNSSVAFNLLDGFSPVAGCFAAKKVCERVSLYNSAWNKPGCIVLRVLFFIFAGLSFVSFIVSTTHWSGANIFLLIQSVVFLVFGVAGDRE